MTVADNLLYRRVVEEYFRIVDAEEFGRLSEVFHTDIIYERPGYLPIIGLHDLTIFYTSERILSAGNHIIDKIVIENDAGSCWGSYVGKTKEGRSVDERFSDAYIFKEGKIYRRITFFYVKSVFI